MRGDHRLVAFDSVGFFRRNEGRPDIGQIGTHGLRRKDAVATRNSAGQSQRPVKPAADLLDQRKGRQRPGMSAGAGGDRDQPVRSLLDGLPGKAIVDNVMEDDTTAGMRRLVHPFLGAKRGDPDRHLVLDAKLHVAFQPFVRPVHDLIDRERCGRCVGIGLVPGVKFFGNAGKPTVQLDRFAFLFPRVQGGKGTHNSGFALGDDQVRVGNDEQG